MMPRTLLLDIDWTVLNRVYYKQTVGDYLLFALLLLAAFLLKKPLAGWLTRLSSKLAARLSYAQHREAIRELLFRPLEHLMQVIMFFLAAEQLSHILDGLVLHRGKETGRALHISLGTITDHVFLFLFILFLTQFTARFIDFVYYVHIRRARAENNMSREQMLPLAKELAKLTAWTLGLFWEMGSVFHVNVPALITGLGIGGVAIALAGKETVENFFAAFTILSDKPFQTGDSIKVGDTEGVVERIGFRSTRLRNADGSEYIIPNQTLVNQNLINLSSRKTRGMKLTAHIRYGISAETLHTLTVAIKENLHQSGIVLEPINVLVEGFEKETITLLVTWHFPHPLPEEGNLAILRQKVNMMVFETISRYAKQGVQISE